MLCPLQATINVYDCYFNLFSITKKFFNNITKWLSMKVKFTKNFSFTKRVLMTNVCNNLSRKHWRLFTLIYNFFLNFIQKVYIASYRLLYHLLQVYLPFKPPFTICLLHTQDLILIKLATIVCTFSLKTIAI